MLPDIQMPDIWQSWKTGQIHGTLTVTIRFQHFLLLSPGGQHGHSYHSDASNCNQS